MGRSKAILLDVDGPLNPYAAKATQRPAGYQTHRMSPKGWETGTPLRVWLNPLHGPYLMTLGVELIWATTWEDDANEWIGPHIGLPKLDVIKWDEESKFNVGNLYWKTKGLVSWMQENRPNSDFIWIDDEPTSTDAAYILENCGNKSGIMKISPRIGLIDHDFVNLQKWVEE